jgi:hypothetical protein
VARGILALAAIGLLAAAGAAAGSPKPVITQRDSGESFTTRMGDPLTVRLTERYRWTRPRVTGDAVRLTQVDYFRDPGFREWTVRTHAVGTSRITAVGYAEPGTRGCDPGPCAPHLFRVTIVVR